MLGKITDEDSMMIIVANGIIPSIGNVLKSDSTVDTKVANITRLVNTYNDFFLTGRHSGKEVE